MPDAAHAYPYVVAGAFALAFIFGAVAQRVDFCAMGSITDIVVSSDWRHMRMWLLAIAVAMVGVTLLQATATIDFTKSIYTAQRVTWLSHIVGGALFGAGMTLASGCGSKTLIRAGTGNLKSWVVLIVMGIAAYMTLKGAFAPLRAYVLDVVRLDTGATTSDLPSIAIAHGAGVAVRVWLPSLLAAALAIFIFRDREFRTTPALIIGGLVVGLVVVGGWYVSGHLGYLAEDPATLEEKFVATNSGRAESFTFVAPVAYSLELLMLWTDQSRVVTFGIAAVMGTITGAFAMALCTRRLRWESFANAEDLGTHLLGAVLMGFGGVTALGCTIGQGITGLSTLALGSFLSFFAIVGGCVAALKIQFWRMDRA
jgi:uncharacterized membrane protein YedE/YeeE